MRRVLDHHEGQSDEQAAAEGDEAFREFAKSTETTLSVPTELVPAARDLIARHKRTA